ncbi:hypothetical protein LWF15_28250 [Kineosporia rhizophila]|uniref:hypothetical protein n=1 Tax=Kineosporia TaxID=49184 RepID=UPI000AED1A04|nr:MULTISPECIES: hypothetical protein [Kineosporia]MCE0539395.1 hypothetical protein [Kineosporia rhizophila]GLY19855.1 hypothetical protein Kisp01_68690 [Kineosporia sp. NBRC 101677]
MVSSTDAGHDGSAGNEYDGTTYEGGGEPADSLELVTTAAPEAEPEPLAQSAPEQRTLVLDEPGPVGNETSPIDDPTTSPVPHDDVYVGDGDEIDLIDGVDPEPVYEPALIDLDDESFVVEAPETDAGTDVVDSVEVPDTLMPVDDYGDVL